MIFLVTGSYDVGRSNVFQRFVSALVITVMVISEQQIEEAGF